MNNEKDYKVWQYLIKGAYVIARRAGFKEVGSYVHDEVDIGNYVKEWRLEHMSEWEPEIEKTNEPSKLLDIIRI